jgi:TonB family protein
MEIIEHASAVYLLNALWQIPLLYAAAWLAIRLLHHAAPRTHHRVWVATLLLQAILPASDLPILALWRGSHDSPSGDSTGVTTLIGRASARAASLLHLPPMLLHLLLAAYACVLFGCGVRLFWTFSRTRAIKRDARPLTLSGAARQSCFYLETLPPAHLGTSCLIAGPVALGIVQPWILFPPDLIDSLSGSDFEAVLTHEFAHIRRHDFLKNLLYQCVTLPIAFHPVLRLTRTRVSETRELVCDWDAARALDGAKPYAHSLLRLASLLAAYPPAGIHHALGIAEANIFERRIMQLTQSPARPSTGRRILLASAAGIIALATCASASALRLRVAPPATPLQDPLKVASRDMQAADKKMPVYPAEAKANHDTVDGSVLLSVLIGKDGLVKEIHVQQSLRPDYDASALEAVKQWRWTPVLVNGEPTEVETTVTVSYSHGE